MAKGDIARSAEMAVYTTLLRVGLVLSSPYWLTRMAVSGHYRAGLDERLGEVPPKLKEAILRHEVIWLHAVSVGEVLAAGRLITQIEKALGEGWMVVISTTTATGQELAKTRFGADRVFFYPLDLPGAVREYLRALRPRLLVLMESELWPRMLVECERAEVPVVVVNARVSDRSFRRGSLVRAVWGRMMRRVTLFLAQSEDDARRLAVMGARPDSVLVAGNLKFDVRAPKQSRIADTIRQIAGGRPILVAGSTTGADAVEEEALLIQAWQGKLRDMGVLLVLAPRHPGRFGLAASLAQGYVLSKASSWERREFWPHPMRRAEDAIEVVILDTIGDLAAVYRVADVAFVGGSLVPRGGHNPLEPAQFGVPVVMGPSWENFRDIVTRMEQEDGIIWLPSDNVGDLREAFLYLLTAPDEARAIGERGREVYVAQSGATARTVDELVRLIEAQV
jgi:3-deoxy-D-manno-octulosonic-acid transferase